MSFSYLFDPNKQFQDRNGVNNVGGFLRVYIDGTDDRATTYKDFNGTLNEADIMLDTDGRAVVIVDDSLTFRIEVYERDGALQWTVTQFTARGEGDGGGSSTPVVVDGTANEIDVTERMTAGVKYYTIGLATVVKNTLLGLIASFSNLVGILNSKADKVQVATAGNLAALDASGNITDSGKKAADFKTKQTPVADPSASGNGLEFIDSVSQDANGEITPHKKSVQDGTTAQKGVVQLQDSIGSTESATDKAVTPHAVREAINAAVSSAYHAAGTKSVAQLTSSLLVAENEGCVYNVTDSGTTTSDFVDGAGHPINAGDNVGVCDVGGGVYKFDLLSGFVDLGNYLTKTGDASNTTSTFSKATGDTSTMTSGGKLSAIFTAISSFFASLKALAFKDKASYNDLSSGVQSSLDKADSALQSHQSVTDNNPTLAWGATSKVGSVGSTDLRVTMPANPAQNLPASVITSGTFGTGRIADDAITAAKVKDNETLPVNISGSADSLQWGGGTDNANSVGYTKLVTINVSGSNTANAGIIASVSWRDSVNAIRTGEGLLVASFKEYGDDTIKAKILILGNRGGGGSPPSEVMSFSLIKISEKIYELWGYVGAAWTSVFATILSIAGTASYPARSFQNTAPAGYSAIPYLFNVFGSGGSPTAPVYVDSNGQVQPCTQGATLKSNTATLYIAGTFGDGNLPYYHVKDVKNGCVNYVHVKDIPYNTCNITIEAPALASGEEYDYVVVFDTFTNSNLIGNIDVENCKTAGHMDNNVFVVDSMALTSGNPRYVPMIVVTGNVASSKWYERL